MRGGRTWVVVAAVLFVGFWVLRGFFGGTHTQTDRLAEEYDQLPPAAEEVELGEMVVELVDPRGLARQSSPTNLLRNLYPTLWNADGYCWEEVTSDFDAETRRVSTGLTDNSDPPDDLLAVFEGWSRGFEDYEYKSFTPRRLIFLHQEMIVTEQGREGPLASVVRIVRMEGPEGRQHWEADESAAVYPCDY